MRGILTVAIKEDEKVQTILDKLILDLQLIKVFPLPKNTISLTGQSYSLEFNTNHSKAELLAQIKNHSQIEGSCITCQIIEDQSSSGVLAGKQETSDITKKQSSKKCKAGQNISIVRQLQYLDNSQDSQTEQLKQSPQTKNQVKHEISEIKSDDQFQVLEYISESIDIKEQKQVCHKQVQDKNQQNGRPLQKVYKQSEHLDQPKQEVAYNEQKKQNLFQLEKLKQLQQKNRTEEKQNDETNIDDIYKYARGKDDYSTVFKIQPEEVNESQGQNDEVSEQHKNQQQNQKVQDKQNDEKLFKQSDSIFIHKSTASALQSSSNIVESQIYADNSQQIQLNKKEEPLITSNSENVVNLPAEQHKIQAHSQEKLDSQKENLKVQGASENISVKHKKIQDVKYEESLPESQSSDVQASNTSLCRYSLLIGAALVTIMGLYLVF